MADALDFPKRYRETFEPHPDVVAECERLLEAAKNGTMRAFAAAIVYHDDVTVAGSVNRVWVTTPGTVWALDTAINRLMYRWRQFEYDDDAQRPEILPNG